MTPHELIAKLAALPDEAKSLPLTITDANGKESEIANVELPIISTTKTQRNPFKIKFVEKVSLNILTKYKHK